MIQPLRLLRAVAGSDRDLLDRYVRDRDEAAFAELVRRYGTGVWAACVRLAGRDAEDAYQAVLLALARKAGTVTGSLPAWLHAVARRVASTLRRSARRRAAGEGAAARPDRAPGADPSLQEGLALLDEELSRLPEQHRAVLIVCCLEGRSRDEAAAHLGWTEGQVKGRLERAREALRAGLARRGVELGGVLLAAAACGPAPARAAPSAAVTSLTNRVVRDMAIQRFKLAAAVLVAAAGAGILLAGGRGEEGKPRPAGGRVEEARPQPGAADPRQKEKGWQFAGQTQAAAAVEVRTLVTGLVTKVAAKEGAVVKKGDVLAEIDPRSHQLDLVAARAKLLGAEAKLRVARLEAGNAKKLVENKVISVNELALHEARAADADATVMAAKVEVERAELTLSWTRLTAPFDGRVSRVQVAEGELVTERAPVLTVVDTRALAVSFNVPEALLLQLQQDGLADPGRLDVAVGFAGEEAFPHAARLDAIGSEVDPRTGSVRFRATVPNPKGLILPGMTARARLSPRPK